MSKNMDKIPDFDDIIFENRNKKYGAYKLRKKYKINVILGLLAGSFIVSTLTITPYLKERSHGIVKVPPERVVVLKMQKLDIPKENITPPPPPPPPMPHHENLVAQQKYVAPKVVDTILPEDTSKFITAEQAKSAGVQSKDTTGPTSEAKEVIPETTQQPFIFVQEMPVFPGGNQALMKYIADHTIYPKVARENNIQGRVIVKFCITAKGGVNQVSILKGVSPELNAEAIRVVKSFPRFIPGRQSGVPVPVWYAVPITFSLK